MDFAAFNTDWLSAWSAKDVDRLLTFYTDDCIYRDQQTAAGITGQAALRGYLEQLFANTPPMTYVPEQVWAIDGGFCGRWNCDMAEAGRLRGFDFVQLTGDRIAFNEVYTHQISNEATS